MGGVWVEERECIAQSGAVAVAAGILRNEEMSVLPLRASLPASRPSTVIFCFLKSHGGF